MTVRLGGLTGRTCVAIVAAFLFTTGLVPGTSRFQAPLDPAVASGATALVRVAPLAASRGVRRQIDYAPIGTACVDFFDCVDGVCANGVWAGA